MQHTSEKVGPPSNSYKWVKLSYALSSVAYMSVIFLFKFQRLLFEEVTVVLKGH